MNKVESPKVSFPANILECSICNEVMSVIKLCKNNHITCWKCHDQMKWIAKKNNRKPTCGVCRDDFVDDPLANILIKNILISARIECRFKKVGCSSKVSLSYREHHERYCQFKNTCEFDEFGCNQLISHRKPETRKAHEDRCKYRIVDCIMGGGSLCEDYIYLGPMGSVLIDHFEKHHSDQGPVRRKTIANPTSFDISGTGLMRGTTFFDHSGDVKFIFFSNCKIFNGRYVYDSFKACLISTTIIPSERYKWKCNISLEHNGQEVTNYCGKIWSINDLSDLHGIRTMLLNGVDRSMRREFMGGLVHTKEMSDSLNNEDITFKFDVWKR